MIITKSLFVEFTDSPKLARRHANNKPTYQAIQESMYGAMDGAAIGQAVEDAVLSTYTDQTVTTIDTTEMRDDRHGTYHARTIKALEENPAILYQPSFLLDDIFVKCDILVRNTS
jgi:hypothetical protein